MIIRGLYSEANSGAYTVELFTLNPATLNALFMGCVGLFRISGTAGYPWLKLQESKQQIRIHGLGV